jgi:malate synthase
MAAQVPIRGDPRSQEAIDKVLIDKRREASEGYQGAWVAHPGLVSVVMRLFNDHPVEPNDGGEIVKVGREDLLKVPEPRISEQAVRANVAVSLRYLESWLAGQGCVAINNLMEDTATVEICRAQIWQWIHHSAKLVEGPTITRTLFRSMLRNERARITEEIGLRAYRTSNYKGAEDLLDKLTTSDRFPEFMTLMAYDQLA